MEKIIFYILSATILLLSLFSVTSRRLLRSAVYLFGVLSAVAGFYFLIGYHFLGAVQLTIYAGGIVVLIIFSILLTHEIDHQMEQPGLIRSLGAGALCFAGAAMMINLLANNPFQRQELAEQSDINTLGTLLLSSGDGGFLLPFELVSILLLAAMIGGIVIAKYTLGGGKEKNEKPTP
ncbi:MAG: NADH-quinone oxidoreductase subunit J [Saprospirales bacterium]|nr:NADH-quinone oxidoreductase subunit J [Saprospirales bacterium]MBK6902356.1 NADH-quinone oxidoreductase subunit J [Saprospirales bacterium]